MKQKGKKNITEERKTVKNEKYTSQKTRIHKNFKKDR
jgi:hypothetical protein